MSTRESDRHGLSRRELLKAAGVTALAGSGASLAACATSSRVVSAPAEAARGGVRLCHFTDPHIRPEFNAVEGTAAAWAHVCAQPQKPDLVVLGGDLIMHSMDQKASRVEELWRVWRSTFDAACRLPTEVCIGNHDIWGWNKGQSGSTGSEARWGKRWVSEVMQLTSLYRTRDVGGWRIIILDSISPLGDSYEGRLDDAQFEWLRGVLASTPSTMPVCIVTHIPILCISTVAVDAQVREQGIITGRGAVMMDVHRLLALFRQHPNVKVCLSGHIHTTERMEYDGVTYICSGAVSGMWWRGIEANRKRGRERWKEGDVPVDLRPARAKPGYMLVDLGPDGSVANRYVEFPWTYAEP